MLKPPFLHLCKKVTTAWPRFADRAISEKFIIEHVSIFRSLSKYVNSSIQLEKKKRQATSLIPNAEHSKNKVDRGANLVHRCSLDSRHYLFMIHGEALARRMMRQKKIFVSNPQEKIVANHHLKRLDFIHASLHRRSIVRVSFDDPPINYHSTMPNPTVDRHFLITRN